MRPPAHIQATIELLDQIEESRFPADRVMASYFRSRRYIGSKDKFAISEHFYSVLRQRLSLAYLLDQFEIEIDSRSLMAATLRLQGLKAADFFDGEQYSPRRFATAELAKLDKIDTSLLDTAPEHVKHNVPEWLASKLKAVLGDSFAQEMIASNQRASTDIRVNQLITNNQQVIDLINRLDKKYDESVFSPWALCFIQRISLFGLPEFKQGWFEIQDQASQLLALLTNVKAGDKVVDFCAGAGGKTLAMAAMMQNKGVIHACDVHTKRLENLSKRAKRAGAHNVRVHTLSSEKDKWIKQQQKKADVVLIDAPCTGTGTWRRSPDSRWNLQPNDLDNLVELQQSILQSASRLVKPGGHLYYATCSLLLEENENQIEQFMQDNIDFTYAELSINEPLKSNLEKVKHQGHQLRTFPALSGADGFYICCLTRQ